METIAFTDGLDSFHCGKSSRCYEILGVHKEDSYFAFRVWAPEADSVFVVGSFNGWEETCPMERIDSRGVFEAKIPVSEADFGDSYKYKIYRGDSVFYKADPFGFLVELTPYFNSVVTDLSGFDWKDEGWMQQRIETSLSGFATQPLNIYELHLGSWKRGKDGACCNYREIADELAPYVKQMGYTHVELLPVAEHPFGGSWGYQVGGFFAPTSRFGSPKDFMGFVDTMHRAGVGVILDWVPGHFPKDDFGLVNFDGSPLYEYADEGKREIAEWGTCRFDFGRREVRSFLTSNAVYWLELYHIDGLRADAVSSTLYLDYGKKEGEWTPNDEGGNLSVEAVEFWRELNRTVKSLFPDAIMIAEESTSFGGVTSKEGGGLGFDFKWNMGWMNDTLDYAATDFKERESKHERLTFPLTYAFSESHILPVSHDEVTYGKKSFLDKMPGDYWKKFAGARAFETFRMTCPGKKLTFMGSEIGQFSEWDCDKETEWFLLDFESHARHQLFCSELNNFYLASPELWECDGGWDGFLWIDPDDAESNLLSYRRISKNGNELVIAVNFNSKPYDDYFLPVPIDGVYEEVFNSDDKRFGGSGVTNRGVRFAARPNPRPLGGRAAEEMLPYAVRLRLPPLGATVLKLKRRRFSDTDEE